MNILTSLWMFHRMIGKVDLYHSIETDVSVWASKCKITCFTNRIFSKFAPLNVTMLIYGVYSIVGTTCYCPYEVFKGLCTGVNYGSMLQWKRTMEHKIEDMKPSLSLLKGSPIEETVLQDSMIPYLKPCHSHPNRRCYCALLFVDVEQHEAAPWQPHIGALLTYRD